MASESYITKTVLELLNNVTVKDLLVTRAIYLCVFHYRIMLLGLEMWLSLLLFHITSVSEKQHKHSFCKRTAFFFFLATFAFYDTEMAFDTILDTAACVV